MSNEQKLRDASKAGNVAAVRELLGKGTKVNAANENGFTALHMAAEWGKADYAAYGVSAEVATVLVEAGANKEARTNWGGGTPLHVAAMNGKAEVVTVLLQAGANKEAKDNNGGTPLEYAQMKGHSAVVDLLDPQGRRRRIFLLVLIPTALVLYYTLM